MSNAVKIFALAMVLALALFLAVLCGGYAPWYFAWLVGTTMIGGLEGIIVFIPLVYLALYIIAWRYTRKRFP